MNFVDFFAGIGGIRLGLEQAGHKCVGFCEFDKYARTAYKAMYDTEHITPTNIEATGEFADKAVDKLIEKILKASETVKE